MKRISIFILLAVLLAACTPTETTEKVKVVQLTDSVSYYPHEVGANWKYLVNGATVSDKPVISSVLGPTVVDGDIWIATDLVGQGIQNTWYRQYRANGVYLLKEERPGQVVNYNPPVQEFPAENSLRVGATWGGNTTVDIFWPDAKPENQHKIVSIRYDYTVVDKRTVTVPAGKFEAFVLNFVSTVADNLNLTNPQVKQETWFVPYVGEIRTENNFYLVDTNVTGVARK
ncbi:MAG TPA: hypothetical protein ENK21_00600 [Trueperaceae bacterium]|nr:hypothetical protein [Trueperaceae bacterium]